MNGLIEPWKGGNRVGMRRLGRSDIYVNPIGVGCMSFTSKENAKEMIEAALRHGVNFFDTADLYEQGRNEEWVGTALKPVRKDVIIATKVGNRFTPGTPGWTWGPTKNYILEAVEQSLRRLQTDYIDLYQLHGGTLEDPIDDIIEAFEHVKQKGIIRYYGISSIRPTVIREYVQKSNIVSVMCQYSLLDRRPEEQVLPLLREHEVGVIARGPVAKGWLSNQGRGPEAATGYLDYSPEEIRRIRQEMTQHVPTAGLTETALSYVTAHPAVTVAIPGSSRMEQLLENLSCVPEQQMPEERREQIQGWLKPQRYDVHRIET